jgi:hypothetical protein
MLTVSLCAMATAPKVTTDKRFVRGATMAFGRMTATGANIKERGFCYAETAEPTIDDLKTTKTLSNHGTIYWLQELKPATKYYMRAYAINKDNEVGYGDVIKFYTIPMGQVTYGLWFPDGTSDEIRNRIKKAMDDACYYFNNMTSAVRDYDVAYSPGTPTADCNYTSRPHMNIGPNVSYQKCGTVMHEMEHGLGLQNYSTQWCQGNLRSGNGTGYWLGDRVTEALQFWDDTNASPILNGDNIHMWPYGVNGAHEDNGSNELYLGNAMICQALGEDGLEHSDKCFAEPYYSLQQEDDVKFYIKNESADRGLYSSFLMPTKTGTLKWVELTAEEAAANDSAAWYFTFTPENQYYQIRNAATERYITYASGIKTATRTSLTANDNWHLMKGRVDVSGLRGYWIIHPESNWTPKCLQANANGATAAVNFNIANSAVAQRWLIMTLDEMKELDSKSVGSIKKEAQDMLDHVKALKDIPHTEQTEGADATFETALGNMETRLGEVTAPVDATNIISELNEATRIFLQSVAVTDLEKPFDLTFMLANPTIDENTDGWAVAATVNYGCAEFYQKTFDFYQTLKPMPTGTYKFCAQGFQRPGAWADAYADYIADDNKVTAKIYAGSTNTMLAHIASEAQTKKIGGSEVTVGGNKYIPDNMQAASLYFKAGLYENSVINELKTEKGSLRMGIKSTSMPSSYWVIFDNFRLYFYGKVSTETLGVNTLQTESAKPVNRTIFTLDGRQLPANAQLRPGLYIMNGKKVVVR